MLRRQQLCIPLREHLAELRAADLRYADERDRRYSEVKSAEEKALKVKEEADKTALGLQRETQQYKDEKANELREQIASERGLYVTRDQLEGVVREIKALIAPLAEWTQNTAGRAEGQTEQRDVARLNINTVIQAVVVLVSIGILYATFHK